uniref:Phospholipase B-like n=1 Tax=Alexandrium catenella TaxID=2925 RepID=A0A7S1RXX2_ALECA
MARLLLCTGLALPLASGLFVHGDSPMEAVKSAIEDLDPFAVASATTMIRLGKESGDDAPKAWTGDRAKALGFTGLSSGPFKAGAVLASGINKQRVHTEGIVGYGGAQKEGVAPYAWHSYSGEFNPAGWEAVSAESAKDAGVDYTKVHGEFKQGHAALEDLKAR